MDDLQRQIPDKCPGCGALPMQDLFNYADRPEELELKALEIEVRGRRYRCNAHLNVAVCDGRYSRKWVFSCPVLMDKIAA